MTVSVQSLTVARQTASAFATTLATMAAGGATMTNQNERVLDQFGKQASSYATLVNNAGADQSQRWVLDAVQPNARDRMLDVGCGTGRLAVSLAPLVGHVIGIDLTEAMLKQARDQQAKSQVTNIEWRQGDVTALPFEPNTFTLVTSSAMLHHVVSPSRVVAEMCRVCAPGGRLFISDLTPAIEKSAAFDAIETLRDPSHVHAMTHAELLQIGVDLGLEVVAIDRMTTRMPFEAVLKTSFPFEGMLERVRTLMRYDAAAGTDSLGFGARFEGDTVFVAYPMTRIVWRKRR
jgi:ubiquinone/menaquinone biosynthesis C-methylase UbiE